MPKMCEWIALPTRQKRTRLERFHAKALVHRRLHTSYNDPTVRPFMYHVAILATKAEFTAGILIAVNQDNGPMLRHIIKPLGPLLVLLVVIRELLMCQVGHGDVPVTFFGWTFPARIADAANHVIQILRLYPNSHDAVALLLGRESHRMPFPLFALRMQLILQFIELLHGTVLGLVLEACHRNVRTSPAWVHVIEIVHVAIIARNNVYGPLPNVRIIWAHIWAVTVPSFYILIPTFWSWWRRRR